LGRYYTIGVNGVIDKDVNIEKLARKMKLLEPWETPQLILPLSGWG
jgi:hypothetical protein